MAQFNKTLSNNSQYRLELVVNYNAYSIPNNTTPVPWTLRVRKLSGSGYWANGTFPWSVNIGGVTSSGSISSYDFRNYTVLNLGSGTATITHDADGKKKINVSGSFTGASTLGNATASGQMDLPTIPRASSFTLSGSTQTGSAISVSISRASTSFTHRVRWRVGSGSWTTVSTNATTSASFTVPHSAFPNSTSGTITVAVQTYNGSTAIGNEQTRTRKLTVPSSIVPNFTTITHSEYVSLVNTQIGEYVQNKSRLNLAITGATAGSGASIKSYRITVDGQTANAKSGTTQVIRSSGTLNIVGTVTDSRNRSVSKTVKITVLPYQEPTLQSISLTRATSTGTQDPFGTFARLNIKARVSSLNGKNTATYRVRSRVAPSGSWTTKTSTTSIGVTGSKTHTYSGYAVTNEYQFEVLITDKLGSQTIMNDLLFLSTGGVPLFVGYDGIASSFGKIPTHGTTYDLEIGDKGLSSDGGYYTNGDIFHKGFIIIPANSDLNNYTEPGWYSTGTNVNSETIANHPNNLASIVEVLPNYTYSTITQRLTNYNTGDMFWRTRYAGTWNPWVRVSKHGHKHSASDITSGTIADARLPDKAKPADYVVEQGTNYTKWNSGKLEQWGRVSSPPRKNTLFNYPITFSTLDTLTGIVDRPGGYDYLAVQMKRNSNYSFYVFTWATEGSEPSSINVNWYAVGRWK